MRLTLNKHERLKKRKLIDDLFSDGMSINAYPLKIVFKEILEEESPHSAVLYGVTVSKKKYKRAVDRNLIKRRLREAYRINKVSINETLQRQGKHISIMAIYVASEILDYHKIETAMIDALSKITKVL